MTYGKTHGKTDYDAGDRAYRMGTREFFERLDREFYSWNRPLHTERPFDVIFPYDAYRGRQILEVGCGLGTMIMNWARADTRVTGVDLNPTAIEQAARRFELFGQTGDFRLADSRELPLADATFDYAYSWGVFMHSPDIGTSVREMMRVLRPGGGWGVMVYNRRSLYEWYLTNYVEGYLHLERRFLAPLELNSRYGDAHREEGNPHCWPMTVPEMRALFEPYSSDVSARIFGTDLDYVFRLLLPGLGMILPRWAKKPWARRWGWSIWISGWKR
jgi:SAM-dependent methyltransferase